MEASEGASVDLAVRLVRQAVQQDSKQNYPEAARCYREAILILQDVKRSQNSTCKELQIFLNTKLVQYEQRLRIIEQHLLSKSDLTKFFKELQSCHFDDCRSSVSSDTKHLYKNPLLVKALDLIRRGRKEDELQNFQSALKFYESGLALLFDVLNKGLLTPRQEETARVKCLLYHDRAETIRGFLEQTDPVPRGAGLGVLHHGHGREDSLDSDCESPVPTTDTDEVLQMMEVRSCSSRLGSTQSLNDKMKQSVSRCSSSKSLHKMSETVTDSVHSLHSLYPVCEIKHSPSVMSVKSGLGHQAAQTVTSVPLANINKEFTLSELSIASTPSSSSNLSSTNNRRLSRSIVSNMEKISVLEISADADDTFDPELVVLKDRCCDDTKSEGSDSGYSDPSPDGTIRDSKSPAGSLDMTDRKSPFSDISEVDGDVSSSKSCGEVIPNVIIVNESETQLSSSSLSVPVVHRQMGRQTSRFQNPNKDILISQISQDKVLAYNETDGHAKPKPSVKHPRSEVKFSPDVYSPRARGQREYVPPRAQARDPRGEHGEMNKGCYYVMAALDFCWCL